MAQFGELDWPDIVVVVIYFAIVMAVGIWSSCQNRGSVGGYFLAGRSMHGVLVGASLFASNIGSGHFIGLAGSGAAGGIGIAVFELNAIFVLMILGWIFVPVYIASGVFTMPEYLRKRFGRQRIRTYLAVLALLLYIFTKISADLYAGAVFIEQSLYINLYPAVIILLIISALFTILGGLTAVIWTDFIQTIIMIIGAIYLMIVSFIKVGGYESLVEKFFRSVPSTTKVFFSESSDVGNVTYRYAKCGLPPANSMHLLRDIEDGSLPWVGVIFGLTISSVWYWCSDQVIVQRALAAKNMTHAKAGCVVAGWLKILPMWLLVIPGMVARILFPDEVGCADPEKCKKICSKEFGCTDIAYPKLVLTLMPVGAKGLMLAVMVASLVSSLTSIFNSSSTIFTIDVWKRFRRQASDMELMIVGRVFVLIMVGVGVAWIPVVKSGSELFHYIQAVTSYLAPPVCAVYVLAIFWKRCNEQGAFWSLMVGLVVGLTRFIWESVYPRAPCGWPDVKPDVLSKMHYLHFGIMLYGITTIVAIVISLLTEPIADKHLVRLLFWNRESEEHREDLGKAGKEKANRRRNENNHGDGGADNPAYIGSSYTVTSQPETKSTEQLDYEEDDDRDLPCYKRCFFWICGIENMQEKPPEISDAEREEMEKKQNSIHEQPMWRRFVNLNAITLMTVAVFFWGFYA